MIEKLSQRDIRVLKIGAVCVAAIFVFVFASEWFENKLELIDVDKHKRDGLLAIVPAFEMPQKEETQRFLFRDKLNEQLKKAGIKNQPLQVASIGRSGQAGYRLLRLKCSAKCRFTQVLDLLANLKENPYLVGVEELRMRIDKKKPQEVDLDLTVGGL
jgi:hypothetical protein